MDFGLTDEQRSIVEVTRAFVERELLPHEEEVERTGVVRPELAERIKQQALATGLYAAAAAPPSSPPSPLSAAYRIDVGRSRPRLCIR